MRRTRFLRAVCTSVFVVLLSALMMRGEGRALAQAADENSNAQRVVLVALPALTWQSVADRVAPSLNELVDSSHVASMSVRSGDNPTSRLGGLATIGAGSRVELGSKSTPLYGVGEDDLTKDQTLILKSISDSSANRHNQLRLGQLGETLHAAQKTTSYLGLDAAGFVMIGDYAGRIDVPLVLRGLEDLKTGLRLGSRTDVLVVDLSSVSVSTAETRSALDTAIKLILASSLESDRTTRTILATPSTVTNSNSETLGLYFDTQSNAYSFEAAFAKSGTTRRAGYVTLADIAPTILSQFNIDTPDEMNGTTISVSDVRSSDAVAALVRDARRADARDRTSGAVLATYVICLTLSVFGLAALVRLRRSRVARGETGGKSVATGAILSVVLRALLAFPTVAFLAWLVPFEEHGSVLFVAALVGVSLGVGAVSSAIERRMHLPMCSTLCVSLATVIMGDIATGSHLQLDTFFGYSPVVAGRFMGLGNMASALLVASAFGVAASLSAATTKVTAKRRLPRELGKLAPALVFLLITLIFVAAPMFGSDVGGTLSFAPAIVVFALLSLRGRLRVRSIALAGVVAVATLSVAAAVDLLRPKSQQTHLARFVRRAFNGDGWSVVERKAASNFAVFTSSPWTLLVPIVIVGFAWAVVKPIPSLRAAFAQWPTLRTASIGALVAGTLAACLNDSGVAIPATMLSVFIPLVGLATLRAGDQIEGGDADEFVDLTNGADSEFLARRPPSQQMKLGIKA